MTKSFGYETNASTGAAVTDGMTATAASLGATTLVSGTHTYAADAKYEGNFGTKIVTTAANTATVQRYALSTTTSTTFSGCLAFSIAANPTSTFTTLWSIRYSSGVALRLIWTSAGLIGVRGQQTTTPQNLSASALTAGHQYVATVVMNATGATTSTYSVKIYDGATRALLYTFTQTQQVLDLTSNPLAASDIGVANSDGQAGQTIRYDSFKLVDGGTTETTPDSWSAPTGPTIGICDGTNTYASTLNTWDGSTLNASTVTIT